MKRKYEPDLPTGCLRVCRLSGEELATIAAEDLAEMNDVRTLKQHLQKACGVSRFRQRLLKEGGALAAIILAGDFNVWGFLLRIFGRLSAPLLGGLYGQPRLDTASIH